ncbi:uncharacterized protein LOC131010213 [Salvia miltiorrhiza]|uniref:uncharacterized protein LOC131010213 n=1 Tax=Salvia miltiorrhiza TaxID=226208 RepID=UPI0025ABC692|nr:uncharacterized protein LOC131010213 [Salvia miltiorrhiza]XP_057793615.1 uncharacterized protein LOC131010213 [Salvia miltiorrhiza]XP_057793616.1 uncharacterized protein LOC131010213 [Salvia miltiorrhiza]XP_057793617.1 uncharacterized protein LOC131010213 [Salvia miltiorrhiza]
MADLKGETVGANASPECKLIKDCVARRGYEGMNHVGALKRLFSPSRLSGFESADSESRHGSTLAFESSSKCHEADMQSSSVGAGSTRVKSEISTETDSTPGKGSLEMDTKSKQRNHLVGGEDGLSTSTVVQDSQHRTESSCSNSLAAVVPVSLAYQSYQDTSKEAYLFRNCGSSIDSSNSKAFDRSPEEPVTASSESGVSAQIANKARRNTNARNSVKISSLGGNHSSSMITKRERERKISRSWDLEAETPENGEVLKEADNVKCDSREGGSVLATKGKSLETGSEVMDRYKDELWVNESADSSMAKHGKRSVKDEDKAVAGFDLNKDFNADELDDCVQPVLASVSSHSVIHVVAKAGIPSGQRPMIPLKFEGGLGWKGTAQTSAFRSTAFSKNLNGTTRSTNHGPRDLEGFTEIDLNVAVEEDVSYEIPTEHEGVSSPSTLQDSHPKSPWIDLNCLYDAAEEFTQPSIPPKQENSPLVGLNLDTERSSNAHWLGQASQFLGSKNPGFPDPVSRDLSFNRSVYLADLSTIQQMANSGHTLMASPQFLQRMELVPRVASRFSPSSVNQPGTTPYTRYFHEHGIFPEAVNPGSVHSFYHPGQFIQEQSSSSNIAAFVPKLELKTEDLLSASGSKGDGPRYFPFLSRESPMGEHMLHQEAWYAASLKRKEPEGGLDCKQLI